MQIVIPMSGFGERFRRAGYTVPKPLIPVEGRPMVAHVVDLFPGETRFVFVCSRDHLAEPSYRMAETLRTIAPQGRIVAIDPHGQGPVHAVLHAADVIDPDEPTIVNYCDFTCFWDYADFRRFVAETKSDGCVPAYRGFHPHSLGSTLYAYMRESGLWMTAIQEKAPFTAEPSREFASSGTYYFRTGRLCLEMFRAQVEEDFRVNGEFYVSLAVSVMAARGCAVSIYELQHFMQWGTPQDLREYESWSTIFRRLIASDGRRARHDGAILLPMAGLGQRFADAGYPVPKPLVPVSGRPMMIQAVRDLPDTAVQRFVLREGLAAGDVVERKLRQTFAGARLLKLDRPTDGQAVTCLLGLDGLDMAAPVTIGACDNGVIYDVDRFAAAIETGAADVLVWVVRGHADGIRRPQMFGWVEADEDGVATGVRVKQAPPDPATAPMIIGAFTFRRAGDFRTAAEALVARDGRVNGEFYVDSVVADCLAAGLRVELFEVDAYIGWGTPVDLQTFEYWQSCFHKWPSHPYRLGRDRRVPAVAVPALKARYAWHPPARPAGTLVPDPAAFEPRGTAGQLLRFLPVGAGTVAIDFAVYAVLAALAVAPSAAKTISFVAGALFSFDANRRITFRVSERVAATIPLFVAVYAATLGLNVAVNAATLAALGADRAWTLTLAWLVATACSAAANFLGLKLLVFRRRAARGR